MTTPHEHEAFTRTVVRYFRDGIEAIAVTSSLHGLLVQLGSAWTLVDSVVSTEQTPSPLVRVLLVHRPTAAYFTFTLVLLADQTPASYALAELSVRRVF